MRNVIIMTLVASVMLCTCASSTFGNESDKSANAALTNSTYDIVVYGGSPSGLAAAVQAARLGSRIMVVEPYLHIGGMMAAGLTQTDLGDEKTTGGLCREFYKRVGEYYNARGIKRGWHYDFEPHVAGLIWQRMLDETERIDVLEHTRLVAVDKADAVLRAIKVRTNEGKDIKISGSVFIDATYEGDLAAMAGSPYLIGREAKADFGEPNGLKKADKLLQAYCFRLSVTDNPENRVAIEKPEGYDPAEFELLGDYVFKQQDATSDTVKMDSIGCGGYPIDSHHVIDYNRSNLHLATPEGNFQIHVRKGYNIPYRIMLPQKVEGLLVSLCVSSTHLGYCTLRMEPEYIKMGQAAGAAAHLAVSQNVTPRKVNVQQLQELLEQQGAITGRPRAELKLRTEYLSKLVSNLQAGRKQVVVTYGTSLTIRGAWVGHLRNALDARYPGLCNVVNSGGSGQWSEWGVRNLDGLVINKKPDTVFIEFSINDSVEVWNGNVETARANLETMIQRIRKSNSQCEIILMTMTPGDKYPKGDRAYRKDIDAHYAMYRAVAKRERLLLIDHYENWKMLQAKDEKRFLEYVPDTVHPTATGCLKVVTPVILQALGIEEAIKNVRHDAVGKKVVLASKPSPLYTNGGDQALTDGKQAGSVGCSNRHWLGFEKQNLDAVVDLGAPTSINVLAAGFLHYPRAGVHLPTEVEFAVSQDGTTFKVVKVVKAPAVNEDVRKVYRIDGLDLYKVRYLRVRAKCDKHWLFVDEVMVNPLLSD